MTILEKVNHLMNERHINKHELSKLSGIPYTTLDGLYKKGYEGMRLPTFRALCDFFEVTMDSMAWDDREIEFRKDVKMPDISGEQRDVAEAYGRADEGMRRGVRLLLKLPEGKNNTLPEEEYLKDA